MTEGFKVHPVLPVTDMARSLAFWSRLGFSVSFADAKPAERAQYAGVVRGDLELHLQTFTPGQIKTTQTMALRIETDAVETLYQDWNALGVITAPLEAKPWGNYEFGLRDPDGTPFFFYRETG
ncbi:MULTISPECIES: VOC family protein [Hyphobacterium]|uniref:VOC family protein n=1 Tax=Hyphobacterium vulgare TaxID=1736751 RepID=A0ABV6ZTX8_9PROT